MLRILSPISRVFWKAFIYARWLFHSFGKKAMEAGERIPDFTLRDLYGQPVTLSHAFPKKAVVLWLTNLCSSCEERIGLLQRVYEEKRDRLEIIAISTLGDDRDTPERILRTHRIDFPLLLDPEDWVGRILEFEHPENACPLYNLLILDQSGRVRLKSHLSAISDAKFLDAVRSIVAVS
ncbi:MAG: TlpA family protein disulfide reductase [Nitrospirae bacterium]|nr:TlpA family protein disulfide reductase [Nitrospirota bacterium]